MNILSRFAFLRNCINIGLLVLFFQAADAQHPASLPFKILDVADGLPQSFISGLIQDSAGFIWIGTRDGLARYDGRKFKLFMHKQGDTTTLANNIISNMYLDRSGRLWILYETGDIDMLYTGSEHLFHFSKHPIYGVITGLIKSGNSIAEDASGNIWFLCTNGGVFICNPEKEYMRFYNGRQLGFSGSKIAGIIPYLGNIALITDTALAILQADRTITAFIAYPFKGPRLYNPDNPWKDTYAIVNGQGDIIIKDEGKLIIYLAKDKVFKQVRLPKKANLTDYNLAQDENGQVIIISPETLFILSPSYELVAVQRLANTNGASFISVLVDRSGILWLGGNGSGIQLQSLRPSGLSGAPYIQNYPRDLLTKYLHVPAHEISNSFLAGTTSYALRWLAAPGGKIWISNGDRDTTKRPAVLYYSNGHLIQPPWQYSDSSENVHVNINAMGLSKSGKLWGMDFFMHPVSFDTLSWKATVYPAIVNSPQEHDYSVNSIVMEGENGFWISTAFDGLYFYDHTSKAVKHYTAADTSGALPSNQLMNLVQDPDNPDILWIGSLGGGLIRFSKHTGQCYTFTMKDGLPNNTIYAVVIDAKGSLWCSTNKGIFSFDRKTAAVRAFTSRDGLPCDEFNRYHYFKFPDGRLSFGGITGLTVFSPSDISSDNFQPYVAITGISINNVPRDFGLPHSPLSASVNSLTGLVLPYHQNFLSFEMASLQYGVTEKLQYRYMLEGFDRQWVYSGTNNIATYTNIPPGSYLLKINATNTAGKWSAYVKTLPIVIQPPFWKTAWFISVAIIAMAGLIYLLVYLRIKAVRKEEQQRANFERQATTLKEQALRAQMNPHFIFNCLNSIKVLIQEDNKKQAVIYLTTFSKLIRNQLNNAQALVSLQAELETCKLYVQLEALRFGNSIVCEFVVDKNIDLYSVQVPPLIIQPFIENAIWHGILPRNGGKVSVTVKQGSGYVTCLIDDDGIGRQMSISNKSDQTSTYESKGMKLVQSRLNLHSTISQYGGTAEVIDKKDAEGNALGTRIILKFSQQQ